MRILTQPPNLAGLSPPLRDIVAAALAKDPRERPAARELLDLLLAAQRQPVGGLPRGPVPDDPRRLATGRVEQAPPGIGVPAEPSRGRGLKRMGIAVVACAALVAAGLIGRSVLIETEAGANVSPPAGVPEAGVSRSAPSQARTSAPALPSAPGGISAILAGTQRTLIHFVEIDKNLALPDASEAAGVSSGSGDAALFALVPMGVDYLIKSVQPGEGEQPCLGIKVIPGGSASLVATTCDASEAKMFTIMATGNKDDKDRQTYTIYNDKYGSVQFSRQRSKVYVEFTGDAEGDTFSFVDQGPL